MPEIKVIVMYPWPKNVAAFEKVYVEEHLPLAAKKIKGVTRFTASKVLATPDGSTPPFYRIAELYFPSVQAIQESMASPSTQEAVAHAIAISTDASHGGGPPIVLIAEEKGVGA